MHGRCNSTAESKVRQLSKEFCSFKSKIRRLQLQKRALGLNRCSNKFTGWSPAYVVTFVKLKVCFLLATQFNIYFVMQSTSTFFALDCVRIFRARIRTNFIVKRRFTVIKERLWSGYYMLTTLLGHCVIDLFSLYNQRQLNVFHFLIIRCFISVGSHCNFTSNNSRAHPTHWHGTTSYIPSHSQFNADRRNPSGSWEHWSSG